MKGLALPLLISIAFIGLAQSATEADKLRFFEQEIRPLLAESCYECHGSEKQKGGLRLDGLGHIVAGGDSGAALVPGKPEESLLIEAVHRLDPDFAMPPKTPLSKVQVENLERWIAMGAPWPKSELAQAEVEERDAYGFTATDREWWAIQPVANPEVPKVGDGWARNAIDAFVARKLAANQMEPAPESSREELVRRAYMDLHGLAPTPAEVQSFVEDRRTDAWERLIDQLLASPRYGERWGQHWLDVVRWSESDGYRQDAFRPHAWPYRDYVVDSFNANKPYDQFVREQLAGDEIAPGDPDVFIGTAYLRNGLYEYNQRNVRMHWELIVNELTSLTGEVFLGVGIGCAQCHDHKFDPILQKDYYRMQAFLAPVHWRHDLLLGTPQQVAQYEAQQRQWEAATADIRAEIDAIVEPKIQSKMKSSREKFPEDIQAMFAKPEAERTPYESQLVALAQIQVDYERYRFDEKKSLKEEDREKVASLRAKLAEFDALKPKPMPEAFVATDIGAQAPKVWLQTRAGKSAVDMGYLTILDPAEASAAEPKAEGDSTGRRLALANWIADPENPLSTRVIVNRIWQQHFGQGIVATPNDFGTLGELPSHPELLDWLTQRFLEGDWRMKEMHRLIMQSATYRQTARREPGPAQETLDPENRFLWRFPPQRLDAEQLRDTMLLVSGELKEKSGGTSVAGSAPYRSIYVKKVRNTPDTMLRGFDAPMGFDSAPSRTQTTTALQSLQLVNGAWTMARAEAFAKRLLADSSGISSSLVREAYAWAYGRNPSTSELEGALAFLEQQSELSGASAKPVYKYPNETGLRPIQQGFGKGKGVSLGESALWLQPGSRFERLQIVQDPLSMDDFTIEAVANLDALYPSADVRTLAARWNGSQQTPGWTFGVTSEKSRYDPRNFIMQLIGQDFQGNTIYEVVASDLRFPLGKPVYFAATVSTTPTPDHKTGGKVTFYMKDLSDPEAELEVREVNHPIVQGLQHPGQALVLGGRGQVGRSLWDGQLARLVLTSGVLSEDQLLIHREPTKALVDLQFGDPQNNQPVAGTRWIAPASVPDQPSGQLQAVTDFCHALLSSNEFLYLH